MWRAWGITDGSAGMAAQVRALAHALNVEPDMKTVTLKKPWKWLPNCAYAGFLQNYILSHALDHVPAGPYPDLIISCGRKGALVSLALKKAHHEIRVIHIQDPQISPAFFDLVVAMEHDKVTGENVIKTRYALHSITPELLEVARAKFAPRFAHYPKPHHVVLFGGSTNKYRLTKSRMVKAVGSLARILQEGGSLLITPSRRTGEANLKTLAKLFCGSERAYMYDFEGENPYLGLLAVADDITVTNDSVNMMSEAYATGKPLHILRLCGHTDTKPARFGEMLVERGVAQWRSVGGAVAHTPHNEMQALAADVKARLNL